MTMLSFVSARPALVAAALLTALALGTGSAAAIDYRETSHLRLAKTEMGRTNYIGLGVNKSVIVDLPIDAGEVIVSQPAVAGAIMRSKRRAIIQGASGGDTNVFFLDAVGNTIAVVDIKVFEVRSETGNALEAAIRRVIPNSNVSVESVQLGGNDTNRVVLSGTTASQDDSDRAFQMAVQFAGGADNVANLITVGGNQQVMLKVTVAEVARDTVKQFGIDLGASYNSAGLSTSIVSNNASGVSTSSSAGIGVNVGPVSLTATLRALEQRGAMRTLAEPTLSAISGQPAAFRAGGDFPYRTTDADGNPVTEFKEYGVFLDFTPTVRSNGVIQLLVDTAVKEPTSAGGVTNRSAKTTVELPVGMTLAIAGLIQDKVRQDFNAFPGLGNVPILGALFRSRDFVRSQTELVILVTPYLAQPTIRAEKPTDRLVFAGDAEATFLGNMERLYGVEGGEGALRGGYNGAIGFVLD